MSEQSKIEADRDRWRAQAHDNYELLMAATKFKTFVHAYLDQHGVPDGDPDNQHQKEGCRIGARLDLIFAERDRFQNLAKHYDGLIANQTMRAFPDAGGESDALLLKRGFDELLALREENAR